jgi:hypothetical protein
MDLKGRNLTQGLTGADVGELHTELIALGFAIPPAEQQAASFGSDTLAAVRKFQAQQGLAVTGVVEATTAARLGETIVLNTYSVSGTVTSPVSTAVGGLTVELVDRNIGADSSLTSGSTDSLGAYRLNVVITLESLSLHHKTKPDLQVRVSAGTTFLAASNVVYDAPLSVTIDVTLPPDTIGLPSEHETFIANVATLYPDKLGALNETKEHQDITFLARKSKLDGRLVAMLALADQLSDIYVAPAPGAPSVNLKPEFYYALLRAGFPANADSLFQASPKAVEAVWQQAIKQRVIPQSLSGEIARAVQIFTMLSAAQMLDPGAKPPIGISNLHAMLQASMSDATPQREQQFARLYSQYRDDMPAFWSEVESAFGAAAAEQLKLYGQFLELAQNNAPLVIALNAAERQPPLKSTLDLATRGYYSADKWLPLIGTSIPPQVPGSGDAQRDTYAELLATQVRLAFPTAVVSHLVRSGTFKLSDPAQQGPVADFLVANQGKFEIGMEPIKAYLARIPSPPSASAKIVDEITRLQLVYQMAPEDGPMAVLLEHKLDSAYDIARYDAAGFIRAFQAKLGGADVAAKIHARAKQIHAAVLNVAVWYLGSRIAPAIGSNSPILRPGPPTPGTPPPSNQSPALPVTASQVDSSYPIIAYPTLEGLFGSLDFCSCQECRSVLSPAAYLVDLLSYLDQPSPTQGYQNPQSVLFQRRPDLQYLPLTCENTNTALPYIDLVNETLEYFVANKSLAGYQGHDTGDTVASSELMANPQYVNDAAYTALQNAYFPSPLPFNRPLELLRLHLDKIGVALPDLMAALRTSDAVDRDSPTNYGWRDILMESLEISRDEYVLFTDTSKANLGVLYGYADAASALTSLQSMSLQTFSRRTGVSYEDLFTIIKVQFINPNATLIPRLERLGASFTTLQSLNDPDPAKAAANAAAFKAALPFGLDPRQYGGLSETDYDSVVRWVKVNLPRILDIITITNPNPVSAIDQCSGDTLQFRYSNPDNSANKISATDFVKLMRFIRLWKKLRLTIRQTDNLLSALFPASNMPSGSDDASNLQLLDQGFVTFLARAGFLFQIMKRLGLSADAALAQLLACWAPIRTGVERQHEAPIAGAVQIQVRAGSAAKPFRPAKSSLYERMFLTPTLLQDSGANLVIIAGPVSAGDLLTTTINTVKVLYTVQAGESPATIATHIADAINSTATTDPTTNLPLNSRIHADVSSQTGVVAIKAGFTLACSASTGATETYAAAGSSPLRRTATVTATTVTAGDVLTTTINNIAIPYTVAADDTTATIAAGIAAAINGSIAQDPFSALPLNTLVLATAAAGAITINVINFGAPFTLACSLSPAVAGSYDADSFSPPRWTATIGGTGVQAGDTLITTINSVKLPFTAAAGDASPTVLASSIAAMINASTVTEPTSMLPMNNFLSASAEGGIVTLTAKDPTIPFTLACSVAHGAETYIASGPLPASQLATVGGTFAANRLLITTINGIDITYSTVAGDTPVSIAANIAAAINATATPDPTTNLPLKNSLSAAAGPTETSGGTTFRSVVVTAKEPTSIFTMTVSQANASYTAGRQSSPFADDGYGNFLQDASQTLFAHEAAICAACNFTGAEFALIAAELGFDASTPLSLSNVSAIFRFGWLAHTLRMSVQEFLLLRRLSGLDPFAALDPGSPPLTEPPAIRFIRLLQALDAEELPRTQVLYLIWNQDISGNSAPARKDVMRFARTLRADLAAVEAQFSLAADPDGTIAKGLMTLVYGNAATDFFFGLLNNTLSVSVSYSNPPGQPMLPQPILNAARGRLSYDDLRKQLSYGGVLDSATQTTIDQAITSSGNYAPLHTALAALASANHQAVAPFFSKYPDLQPVYEAYVASPDPPATRRTALLNKLQPSLKYKRKQEQALASLTAAAGTDPSFADALLQDATILHAADASTAAARPALADLTAIETEGLSVEFFLSNKPEAESPEIMIDATGTLAYSPCVVGALQTTIVGGKAGAGDVLTTTINGRAVPYTVGPGDSSVESIAANIAAAINATTAADPYSGLPLNNVISASASSRNVTIKASNTAGGLTLACSTQLQKAAAYSAGAKLSAWQTVTIGATTTPGDVVTTTINGVAIPYTVASGDTTPAILASHIAGAINATTTADPVSGQPLNRIISAANAAEIITITAVAFGPSFTLACSPSPGASETCAAGPLNPATRTAIISGVLAPGGGLITTINGTPISYVVSATDTTETSIAAKIAQAINAATNIDPVSGRPINAVVSASSSGGTIAITAGGAGAPFTLACSLSSYTTSTQFPAIQTGIVSGGITPGDVLTTTINGVPIPYLVATGDTTVTLLAGHVAAAINATTTPDPLTGKKIKDLVTASSTGGVITITPNRPGISYSLTCSSSPGAASNAPNATETYVAGPQFLAYEASIAGGFSTGDVLTTTINSVDIPCAVTAADNTASALAQHIAATINATTTADPITALPLNRLVNAESADGTILLKINGAAFTLSSSLSAGATETYYVSGTLPAGEGTGTLAGKWTGYLNAPQDGLYDIDIVTDAGASVTLTISNSLIPLVATQNRSVWSNQGVISLTAGALTPLELVVESVRESVSVSWRSPGIPSQIIPGEYLYSLTLVDRLRATYISFLKATSLAVAVSFTANELAWLATATSFRVNTDSHVKLAPGPNATFTPASMDNIKPGCKLVIDIGSAQETVTVVNTTATTFSAITSKLHDGSSTPYPIVNMPFPNIGQGWLNFLAASGDPDAAAATGLRDVLMSLLDYARIKQALSPKDERLLSALNNPAAVLANGKSALMSLTGWDRSSVNALMARFFGDTDIGRLSSVATLRRIYDAYAFLRTCRISAAALIGATTNAPSPTTVATLQAALRALYAESDWLTVLRPISDAMRIRQRDALVAYILQQKADEHERSLIRAATVADAALGATTLKFANTTDIKSGMQLQGVNVLPYTTVTAVAANSITMSAALQGDLPAGSNIAFDPGTAPAIDTSDKLFEYFLIDVETQPAVETSRVRFHLSSAQLFGERIRRNLEPQVCPSDIDGSLWPWMKRYRVWQANREVFLWPENWLYPELRDDQSPFFQETMSALLQGDVTDDAAANAYLDYLTKLEEVAKLEPCGLYYLPQTSDADEIAYVVARTAGAHRKYYFRTKENGSWTPWTEVKVDCEDMPIMPIMWNGRLLLFWLKVLKQPPQDGSQAARFLPDTGPVNNLDFGQLKPSVQAAAAPPNQQVEIRAALCWSEFYNGKWQPTKTSDINRPTSLGNFPATGPGSFDADRNLLRIEPAEVAGDSPFDISPEALILVIRPINQSDACGGGGFVLYSTHSLPVRLEDFRHARPRVDSSEGDIGNIGFVLYLSDYLVPPDRGRTLAPIQPYTGANAATGPYAVTTFNISYWMNGISGSSYNANLFRFSLIPRYVEPQPGLPDAWDAPFFFEDRRNLFYVTTNATLGTIQDFTGFGILSTNPSLQGMLANIPPLVFPQLPPRHVAGDPILAGRIHDGGPTAIQGYLSETTTIRVGIGSGTLLPYQGRQISLTGSSAARGSSQ